MTPERVIAHSSSTPCRILTVPVGVPLPLVGATVTVKVAACLTYRMPSWAGGDGEDGGGDDAAS